MRKNSAVALVFLIIFGWLAAPVQAYYYNWGGFPFTGYAGYNPAGLLLGSPYSLSNYSYYSNPYRYAYPYYAYPYRYGYGYNYYNPYSTWPLYLGGGLLMGAVGYGLYRSALSNSGQYNNYAQSISTPNRIYTSPPSAVDQSAYGQYAPVQQPMPVQPMTYQPTSYYPPSMTSQYQSALPATSPALASQYQPALPATSPALASQYQPVLSTPSLPLSLQHQSALPGSFPPIASQVQPLLPGGAPPLAPDRLAVAQAKGNPQAGGFVDMVNVSYGGDLSKALKNQVVKQWAQSIGLLTGNNAPGTKLRAGQIAQIRSVLSDPTMEAANKVEKVRLVMSGNYI